MLSIPLFYYYLFIPLFHLSGGVQSCVLEDEQIFLRLCAMFPSVFVGPLAKLICLELTSKEAQCFAVF